MVIDLPITKSSKDRHQLIWKTSKDSAYLELLPGSSIFVKFQAHATGSFSGKMYVDAVVDFEKSLQIYSWPTAPVTLTTIYSIKATDADGQVIAVLEVLVESKNGEITNWTIGS